MTINDPLARLAAELEEGGIPEPLGEAFTLALVWHDLARLAGESVPPAVAAYAGRPAAEWLAPVPAPAIYREPHAEPA